MPRTFPPDALPPQDALTRLRDGNLRFVAGEGNALRRWHPGLADGQSPFAVVLGCADSRAPAEYVFDQGLGDLFVIRVAGNIVAPSLVGSVEFAVSRFGTRLVVVMGHTRCGAVAATVDFLAHGGGPESRNLRSIVDRITPHVKHLFDAPGDPQEILATAVRVNAEASARELRRASPFLQDLVDRGRIVIVSAVYDLDTGVVTFDEE
jgi:carbonic anhydrase